MSEVKNRLTLWKTLLSISWVSVHIILLLKKGIITQFEAGKYIDQAYLLIETGQLSAVNLWFYSLQILLLSLAIIANTGFIPVYILQLSLNGVSTLFFFKFCRKKVSTEAACIATALLIFNIPLQEFTCYLQTESLFISLSIFFTYYLSCLQAFHLKNFIALLCFLILLSITRPNGLTLLVSSFSFLFVRFAAKKSFAFKIAVVMSVTAVLYWIINFALGSGGEWRFMLAFQKEIILCADNSYFTNINTSANPNSIEGFAYYISHNWPQFARLALLKTTAFFGLCRSYFSPIHNLYLIVYMYPIYFFVLYGINAWVKTDKDLFLFLAINLLLALLTVVLTCDDVHNRFFLILCPYLYILSLPALQKIVYKRESH